MPAPRDRAERRGRSRALLLLALPLLLAACGGTAEDGDASAPAPTSPSASESAPESAHESAPAGGSERPSAAASESPSGGAEAPPSAVPDLEVRVEGGGVEPAPGPVEATAGEPLLVAVTVDADDELHAHGTTAPGGGEVEVALAAGETALLELVWEQPGSYELELHDSGLLLAQVQVR